LLRPGRTLKLPKEDEPFGITSVADIVSHSSNRGAAQLAMLMGEQRFYDYARLYVFGQPTGFGLGDPGTADYYRFLFPGNGGNIHKGSC